LANERPFPLLSFLLEISDESLWKIIKFLNRLNFPLFPHGIQLCFPGEELMEKTHFNTTRLFEITFMGFTDSHLKALLEIKTVTQQVLQLVLFTHLHTTWSFRPASMKLLLIHGFSARHVIIASSSPTSGWNWIVKMVMLSASDFYSEISIDYKK